VPRISKERKELLINRVRDLTKEMPTLKDKGIMTILTKDYPDLGLSMFQIRALRKLAIGKKIAGGAVAGTPGEKPAKRAYRSSKAAEAQTPEIIESEYTIDGLIDYADNLKAALQRKAETLFT